MEKKFFFSILALMMFTLSVFADSKINPYLLDVLSKSNDNDKIRIYITFNDPLTLQDFADIPYDAPKSERRKIVIDRLISHANNSQYRVKSFMSSRNPDAELIDVIWMVNAIVLKANRSVIYDLDAANFSEINQINLDPQYPSEQMIDDINIAIPFKTALAPEIGVMLMNADDCWALGNRGAGVLVANADDGFWWKHPDLVKGVWQNLGEDANHNGMTIIWGSGTSSVFDAGDLNGIDDDANGKIDDIVGWDFTTGNYNITTASHGSATLGHVIGDGTGGTSTGVSPDAKCILMRNASGYTQQILTFQYALQMGADIVTSSLSFKWYFSPKPDYSLVRQATDMSLAAGMVHSNSTSNDGNSVGIPLNISSAGCNPAPWRHPDQLKIGGLSGVIGVGNVSCSNDIIASSSPYGPTLWGNWALWGAYPYTILAGHSDYPYSRVAPVETPDSMGLLKPDLSAPGENSISTYVSSGTGYGTFGGTSSATPHTGGALALMLSINPEMLPADLDRVLELTAIEKGDPGKDYRYGAGRIDVLLATTSPSCLTEGVNGGSNWLINQTTPANDTARELVGLKLKNTSSPWIGSMRQLVFARSGTAGSADIEKFRLFWDVNKNSVVDAGDRLLSEANFNGASNQIEMNDIKFKVTDSLRHIILCAKTKPGATGTNTVTLGMPNNTYFKSYYTTVAQAANFPYGTTLTGNGNNTENPVVFSLQQNYPNPFNPTTIISYSLARQSLVKVRVFDAIGRETAMLLNNVRDAGIYNIEFDANFYKGLSSGIYFYKLEAYSTETGGLYFEDIKKMVLVK
jgi:hypothetical protein